MTQPNRIPIPAKERWRDARQRFLPLLVFMGAVAGIASLWSRHLAAPTFVGQVEPVQAAVSCYKPGTLSSLTVTRFQNVRTGDAIGQVLIADPRVLATSLAVIQADIEMLRVGMQPIATQQRTAMDYSRLRLDWMRQRSQLAMARVNLQLAEADLRRTEELYREKIVSDLVLDQAKAQRERFRSESEELARLVDEQSRNFDDLLLTNTVQISRVTDEPLRAAIAAQEARLRQTEAELSPIVLRAPIDGMVSTIYRLSGEAVTAGEPILSIAALNSTRIVGYLRPPLTREPRSGWQVQVRTRGPHAQVAAAKILQVGTQFETISPALQTAARLATVELGLPLSISVPGDLRIRPGELVDVTLLPKQD